ncbi:MAG: hypothetical protein E6J17_01060, partial [Chloroflexi bacterium]
MAYRVTPRPASQPSVGSRTVTRRQVLGGIAGVAGLAAAPSLIAACSTPAASPSASSGGAPSASAGAASAAASAGGTVTLGSNYSDPLPKGVLQKAVDKFTSQTGIQVKINTVDHGTFQNQISSYLQ